MAARNTILLNWNANGLKTYRNMSLAFLNLHEIVLACLSETHSSSTYKTQYHCGAERFTQVHAMRGVIHFYV